MLVAIVVELVFFRVVTGDPEVSGHFGVGGGVLAGRVVAAPDAAALRAPAEVKPPSALLFTFHATRASGRDIGVDARIFRYLLHESSAAGAGAITAGKSRSGNAARVI